MLTITETAKILGLSEGRVRVMAQNGVLHAEKHGRQWLVYERSVEERAKTGGKPGRPKSEEQKNAHMGDADIERAYSLYLECRETLSSGLKIGYLEGARSEEERAFYVHVANFFLSRKCEELVAQGVY